MELRVTRVPFELHPEVPPGGTDIASFGIPAAYLEKIWLTVAEFGLPVDRTRRRISNTHKALLIHEWAVQNASAQAPEVHRGFFQAYFAAGRDLAEKTIILDVCAQAGLPGESVLADVTADQRYEERLGRYRKAAQAFGVRGVPAFVVDQRHLIAGTLSIQGVPAFIVNKRYIYAPQPFDALLALLREIATKKREAPKHNDQSGAP